MITNLFFKLSIYIHLDGIYNILYSYIHVCPICGMWWCISSVKAFRPEGRGFKSRSTHHIETLGKSLTRSCLWRFGVKLQHSIRAVSGVLLSSGGLEEVL